MLMPWNEVVRFRKQNQSYLLKMIRLYEKMAKQTKHPEEINARILLYKRLYLGLPTQ